MRAKTYTCIQDVLSNSKDKSKEHAIKYIWEIFSSLTNSCMKFLTWVISWMMLLFGVSCCWRSCANDLNFDNKASSHSLSPDSEMPLSVRDAEFWKIIEYLQNFPLNWRFWSLHVELFEFRKKLGFNENRWKISLPRIGFC